MTILLLIICILSSGFTSNIYKKLSDDCIGRCETVTTPSVWFLFLTVGAGDIYRAGEALVK